MPAQSKKQQRLMGQAYDYKKGDLKVKDMDPKYVDEIKKLSKSMTEKQLRDFASTKHEGIPEKVEESKVLKFSEFIK
jgi:major membrane immunogen (membrane-anchored lipoprotein)